MTMLKIYYTYIVLLFVKRNVLHVLCTCTLHVSTVNLLLQSVYSVTVSLLFSNSYFTSDSSTGKLCSFAPFIDGALQKWSKVFMCLGNVPFIVSLPH